MKISLKNFRCYKEYSLDLNPFAGGATAFILGASGRGKTTLLDAIIYCLYGKGKNIRPLEGAAAPPCVEIEIDGFKIKRSTNVFFTDRDGAVVSDMAAQEKIAAAFGRTFLYYSQTAASLFFEMSPRDQLDALETILFGGEVSIKDLKERFQAEKRALDALRRDHLNQRSLTIEFLNKLQPREAETNSAATDVGVDERKVRRRLAFLRNRQSIHDQYLKKRESLERELADLATRAAQPPIEDIPYTRDQLVKHIDAAERLSKIKWQQYMSYSVEECQEELESYQEERETLVLSQGTQVTCPECSAALWYQNGTLCVAREHEAKIQKLLEDFCVSSVAEALDDVEKQIRLFSEYKSQRDFIDSLRAALLSDPGDARALLQKLNEKERGAARGELLFSLIDEKKRSLKKLNDCAEQFSVLSWKAEQEIRDAAAFLENAALHELRLRESQIREEYETRLAAADARLSLLGKKQAGLARAQTILAETEQEYFRDMMESLSQEMNQYIAGMFPEPFTVDMKIEASAAGARKLRISFSNGYLYEMFSGGERARLNMCIFLALANFQKYRLLLLDEFTRYLDSGAAARVFETIRANFQGIIIAVEHECPDFPNAQKIWL